MTTILSGASISFNDKPDLITLGPHDADGHISLKDTMIVKLHGVLVIVFGLHG